MTKEEINMKFSDYIRKQGDEFRRAGDGYEALSDTSKACIDFAVQRYLDEYAAKQQAVSFGFHVLGADPNDPEMGGIEEMTKTYDSFIEQQNKQA